MLDIAKLIFAGIIIGGIMTEEINRWVLYLLGLFAFVLIIVIGFVLCSQVKKGGLNNGFYYIFLCNVDSGNIDTALFRSSG